MIDNFYTIFGKKDARRLFLAGSNLSLIVGSQLHMKHATDGVSIAEYLKYRNDSENIVDLFPFMP